LKGGTLLAKGGKALRTAIVPKYFPLLLTDFYYLSIRSLISMNRNCWMLLLLGCGVLIGCGDKFDYRHRFVGNYAMRDSFVGDLFPTSTHDYEGAVYQGNVEELVFELEGEKARVLKVDRKGNLSDDSPSAISGKFSDKDHFSYSRLSYYPFSSDHFTVYTIGIRIQP
jgi:hypothetical protein